MQGFDVGRFVNERLPTWEDLATLLTDVEDRGLSSLESVGRLGSVRVRASR